MSRNGRRRLNGPFGSLTLESGISLSKRWGKGNESKEGFQTGRSYVELESLSLRKVVNMPGSKRLRGNLSPRATYCVLPVRYVHSYSLSLTHLRYLFGNNDVFTI